MRESKVRKTHPLYLANGVMMALSFLIFRVLLMGWLGWRHFIVLRREFRALPSCSIAKIAVSAAAQFGRGQPLSLLPKAWGRPTLSGGGDGRLSFQLETEGLKLSRTRIAPLLWLAI